MVNVLLDDAVGLMYNDQGLMKEQLFADDFGMTAYITIGEFINDNYQQDMTDDDMLQLLRATFPSVSTDPFEGCNRITITQLLITVYYDPHDVNGVELDTLWNDILNTGSPKSKPLKKKH